MEQKISISDFPQLSLNLTRLGETRQKMHYSQHALHSVDNVGATNILGKTESAPPLTFYLLTFQPRFGAPRTVPQDAFTIETSLEISSNIISVSSFFAIVGLYPTINLFTLTFSSSTLALKNSLKNFILAIIQTVLQII